MRTAKSCGPDAAVLASNSQEQASANDGGKRAVHRGEHEVSRKATAQGRPGCSACTCMLVCVSLCAFAHETAGAACTRSSLRPLLSRDSFLQGSDAMRREIANGYPFGC